MRYKFKQLLPDSPEYPDEAFFAAKEVIRSCRSSIYISPSQESVATEIDIYSWIKDQKAKFHYQLEEEEIEDALKEVEEDESLVQLYKRKCFENSTAPINQIIQALSGERSILNLNSYCLDAVNLLHAAKFLSELDNEHAIKELHLRNNSFNGPAFETVSLLIQKNEFLSILDISYCKLDDKTKELLGEAIKKTVSLKLLNLYNCDLCDEGGVIIFDAMIENNTIEELNVGHNQLSCDSASSLMKWLPINGTIKKLYLHWNSLYPQKDASIKLSKGLKKNKSIAVLDLSWNGLIGEEFVKTFTMFIRSSKTLTHLNLEYNCLTQEDIQKIVNSSRISKSLEEIHLGMNYFWEEDDILEAIKVLQNHKKMKRMSIGQYTYVTDVVTKAIQKLKQDFPEKDVVYYNQLMPSPPDPVDFKAIVINRSKFLAMKPKKKKLRKEMGHFMHQLLETEREYMTSDEFKELLKKFKAKIDDDLKNHLEEVFTEKVAIGKKKVKRVLIKNLAEYYLKRHPTEPLPPPKPKKEKKKKGKGLKKK